MKSSSIRRAIVLISIVACIAAVAFFSWDWYVESGYRRYTPAKYACVICLQQIAGATEQWALEHKKTLTDTPTWADLVGVDKYVKVALICPQGGTYTLGAMFEKPRCSILHHQLGERWSFRVYDEAGVPIPDASVSVGLAGFPVESRLTDSRGHLLCTNIPALDLSNRRSPNMGSIFVSKDGFESKRIRLDTGWPSAVRLKKKAE